MKYTCLILLWSLFATMALPADNLIQSISIVPCPESITPGTGYFTFSGKTDFTVENEEQAEVARCFSALFTQAAGFTPCVKVGEKKGKISFLTDDALKSEAYHLEITPRQIIVKASDTKGFFYALQTIRQLLPASIEGTAVAETADWSVPAMTIKDEPRFGYRGLMVDVARVFIPKENLLRIIDCMGMLKINTLHLHLVDDNGWRIEIKRYPLLTEIGSRRVDRPGKSFPERRNPRQGEPTVEKGFYTQEDIREIVAYAARHQVEVIPEIEMPAHSNAALASYPLLACPVVDKFIGVLPGLGGNHADVIFCAGNDSVFTFLQGVIDEVVELFPSRYIHLGGDEARKTHWKECPLCQERMRQEGLEDEEALQGYFMARMSEYVQSKGKEAMSVSLNCTDAARNLSLNAWPPQKSAITVYAKNVNGRQVIHLLNFLNADNLSWRDLNGTMPEPRLVSDVPLKMNVSGKVNKIWVASPDFHAGASQELSFEQKDGTVTFILPLLKYWSMLVME